MPLTEQQKARYERYGFLPTMNKWKYIIAPELYRFKESDFEKDDFDINEYKRKSPIELDKDIELIKEEIIENKKLATKYSSKPTITEKDATKSAYYYLLSQLAEVHILELQQLQAIKRTQQEIASYGEFPSLKNEKLVNELKKTLEKLISGETLYLPQGKVELKRAIVKAPPVRKRVVEEKVEEPKLKPPPVRTRVVEKPLLIDEDEPDEDEPLDVIIKPLKKKKENEVVWINNPKYNGKNLFIQTNAKGTLFIEDISDTSKMKFNLTKEDLVNQGLLGKKGYDIIDKWVIPNDKIVQTEKQKGKIFKLDDLNLYLKVEDVQPELNIGQDEDNPTKFLSKPSKNELIEVGNKYEWKSVGYSNTTPVFIKLGELKQDLTYIRPNEVREDITYYIPKEYLTTRPFADYCDDFELGLLNVDGEPVLDCFFGDEKYLKMYKKYLKKEQLKQAGIEESEALYQINKKIMIENEDGKQVEDKTVQNSFIKTTAIGSIEIEKVKNDIFIPYKFIKDITNIPEIELDEFYIQLDEIKILNAETYYASPKDRDVTFNLKSPYSFKLLTFKPTVDLFIRLGYRTKKVGLTFYINKKDIVAEDIDSPDNPNPYENTEYSDDFLKYKQQRDRFKVKKIKDIRITGEQSGYEGVISERTPAENELASYLVKPKKSKTDEPLSVLSVLERLPINEADRKEEISQLKKQYAESQLEDAPDKELVKELIKIIPEISVPKPAETEVVFFGTQRVTRPKRFSDLPLEL